MFVVMFTQGRYCRSLMELMVSHFIHTIMKRNITQHHRRRKSIGLDYTLDYSKLTINYNLPATEHCMLPMSSSNLGLDTMRRDRLDPLQQLNVELSRKPDRKPMVGIEFMNGVVGACLANSSYNWRRKTDSVSFAASEEHRLLNNILLHGNL